ncbi:hypothetical protein CDD83_10160 [Cordyceps sp. RAO-2017]|nr:hypothetical protein CDD83_10160 [Cordyceps sp. RAO-2017]
MRLTPVFVFVGCAVQVLADYGQTSRCYIAKDRATRNVMGRFLENGTDCVHGGDRTLDCLEDGLDRVWLPLISPLIDVIRRWERYYGIQINEAFVKVGRSSHPDDWNAWARDRTWNAWERLLYHWNSTGWLCFYDHNPRLSITVEPREAGLLTLFFSDKNALRSPVLKVGKTWRFDQTYACSAENEADRLRQVKVITRISENIKSWGLSTWQLAQEARIYLETYSTDPFLQAAISTWFADGY